MNPRLQAGATAIGFNPDRLGKFDDKDYKIENSATAFMHNSIKDLKTVKTRLEIASTETPDLVIPELRLRKVSHQAIEDSKPGRFLNGNFKPLYNHEKEENQRLFEHQKKLEKIIENLKKEIKNNSTHLKEAKKQLASAINKMDKEVLLEFAKERELVNLTAEIEEALKTIRGTTTPTEAGTSREGQSTLQEKLKRIKDIMNNQDMDEEISTLRQEKHQQEELVQSLQMAQKKVKEELDNSRRGLTTVQKELSDARKEHDKLNLEYRRLYSQYQKAYTRNTDLSEQKTTLTSKVESLEKEKEDLRVVSHTADKEKEKLQSEILEAKGKIKQLKNHAKNLSENLESALKNKESVLEQLKKEKEDRVLEDGRIRERNLDITKRESDIIQARLEMELRINEKEKEIRDLKDTSENKDRVARKQEKTLQKEKENLIQELTQAKEQLEQMSRELEKVHHRTSDFLEPGNNVTSAFNPDGLGSLESFHPVADKALYRKAETFTGSSEKAIAPHSDLQSKIQSLQATIRVLEEEKDQLNGQIKELKTELATAAEEREYTESQLKDISSLQEERERLKNEITILQKELLSHAQRSNTQANKEKDLQLQLEESAQRNAKLVEEKQMIESRLEIAEEELSTLRINLDASEVETRRLLEEKTTAQKAADPLPSISLASSTFKVEMAQQLLENIFQRIHDHGDNELIKQCEDEVTKLGETL